MQNYQKIEKTVLKYSLLIFIVVFVALQTISIIIGMQELANGAVIGYAVSVLAYILTVRAIDSTLEYKAAFFVPIAHTLKMGLYGAAMLTAVKLNFINLWSLFGCLFIIKASTYYVQLGGKING